MTIAQAPRVRNISSTPSTSSRPAPHRAPRVDDIATGIVHTTVHERTMDDMVDGGVGISSTRRPASQADVDGVDDISGTPGANDTSHTSDSDREWAEI